MALKPWLAERTVDAALARELIEARFAQLAPARVEPLGEGWDNTVYRVNEVYVFRFPRRQIAVPLIQREIAVLPKLALPLPTPGPAFVGAAAGERFPWPFAGYRMLAGRTADQAALTPAQRAAQAPALGRFLQALHALPLNAGPDSFDRMNAARIRKHTGERLRELELPVPPWFDEPVRAPVRSALVHGDLHARQLLVEDGALSGVIDWGDVHFGDPACDLSIAWTFLPPAARPAFRAAYGFVDEETWCLARLRGLHLAAALAVYARHVTDERLLREALQAFEFVRTS